MAEPERPKFTAPSLLFGVLFVGVSYALFGGVGAAVALAVIAVGLVAGFLVLRG